MNVSYSHTQLGLVTTLVEAGVKTYTATLDAATGTYKKRERAAKSDLQTARYELEAAQAGASATEQSAQITAGGAVDAATIRIAAAKKAREKLNKTLLIGAVATVLGIGAIALLFGGKAAT